MGYSSRSGFPHSDISGSKLHCQLPRAFRRLVRPSSPVIAKASTTCTYSLDPITLRSLPRSQRYRQLGATPIPQGFDAITTVSPASQSSGIPAIQPSSILLKNIDPVRSQACRVKHPTGLTAHQLHRLVEDDGIEPTTPCLQSRCSPS